MCVWSESNIPHVIFTVICLKYFYRRCQTIIKFSLLNLSLNVPTNFKKVSDH